MGQPNVERSGADRVLSTPRHSWYPGLISTNHARLYVRPDKSWYTDHWCAVAGSFCREGFDVGLMTNHGLGKQEYPL